MWARLFAAKQVVFLAVLLLLGLGASSGHAQTAQLQTAVEYYHAEWDHYFLTSFPEEIAALDGGAFGGAWKRSGQSFSVWDRPTNGAVPTCRFFSRPFDSKSSHFYTADPTECANLQAGTDWQYEGIAFYILPTDQYGYCPVGTAALIRFYNNGMGGAPNHRLTTSAIVANEMMSRGWLLEDDLEDWSWASACVPIAIGGGSAEGLWRGPTFDGWKLDAGIVLEDGTFYFFFSRPPSPTIGGVVQGTSTSVDGYFTSTDARGFGYGAWASLTPVEGTYLARANFTAGFTTTNEGGFESHYDPAYAQHANPAAAAGAYAGSALNSGLVGAAALTLNPDGAISGSGAGCSFSGVAVPRGAVNAFDLSLTFNGGGCVFGTNTLTGLAYFDAPSRTLYAAVLPAGRTDVFYLVGTKP